MFGGGEHDFIRDDISFVMALVPFVLLATLLIASLLEVRLRMGGVFRSRKRANGDLAFFAEPRHHSKTGITVLDVNANSWGPALSGLRRDVSVVCRMEVHGFDHRSTCKQIALLGRRAMHQAIEAFRYLGNPQHAAWQDFIFTLDEMLRYHERLIPMCEVPECVRLQAFVDENADALDTALESVAS